jgi:hypothetical protein
MTDVAGRLRAAGLAVRPLKWRDSYSVIRADTKFGSYLTSASGKILTINVAPGSPQMMCANLADAKAAAQADYEARILAALCSTLERSAHTPPRQGLDLDEAETRSDTGQ